MPALEPKQARSRESLRKLLKAAREVLGQHGIEGATVPRIAQHAGLSPGSVYRRFPDKDALLEAAILGLLEQQRDRLAEIMKPAAVQQIPLAVFADQIIANQIVAHRGLGPLLLAMRRFTQLRQGSPFWRRAARLEAESLTALVDLFLTRRHEIHAPNPRQAVALGLLMVTNVLFQLLVEPASPEFQLLLPRGDDALRRELLRAFLAYLGVEPSPFAASPVKARRRPGNRRDRVQTD